MIHREAQKERQLKASCAHYKEVLNLFVNGDRTNYVRTEGTEFTALNLVSLVKLYRVLYNICVRSSKWYF